MNYDIIDKAIKILSNGDDNINIQSYIFTLSSIKKNGESINEVANRIIAENNELENIDQLNSASKGNPYRAKDGKFTTGPGKSSGESTFSRKIISESELDSLVEKYNGENYESGNRNELMTQVSKELNYNKKPKKIDAEEFELLKKDGNIELYRGYSDQSRSAQEYMKDFREGELWTGNGHYGSGTYTFMDKNSTMSYASGNLDNIQVMSLSKNAKIADYKKEYSQFVDFTSRKSSEFSIKSEKAYMSGDDSLGEKYDNLSYQYGYLDFGVYAAYKGYDAVKYSGDEVDPRSIMIVLNRGMISVPKEYN